MLYVYSVLVQLVYNQYQVGSVRPVMDIIYEFEGEAVITGDCTISLPEDGLGVETLSNEIIVRIVPLKTNDKSKVATLTVSGLVARSEKEAAAKMQPIVEGICKRITFHINKTNVNKHAFQPRIDPLWKEAKWDCKLFSKYVEVLKSLKDGRGERICNLVDSCHITFGQVIKLEEICWGEGLLGGPDDLSYLYDEYYYSFGTENPRSKFFHLFVIIEYCEEHYKSHNGSKSYFLHSEIEELVEQIEDSLPEDKRKKAKEIINREFSRTTDIGRSDKILNILHHMNIHSLPKGSQTVIIDKHMIQELVGLRNRTFHGNNEDNDRYKKAVEDLLYIDEMILSYMGSL